MARTCARRMQLHTRSEIGIYGGVPEGGYWKEILTATGVNMAAAHGEHGGTEALAEEHMDGLIRCA